MWGGVLFLFGCASGGGKSAGTRLFVEATVASPVDAQNGVYWLAFQTDGDPSSGPFFSGSNLLNTNFYIALEGGLFKQVALLNGQIQSVVPFTQASFQGNKIQYFIPLSTFPVSSLDISFFTFQLDANLQKVLIDGLFDPQSDALGLHFNTKTEANRLEQDPPDGLAANLGSYDLQSLLVQVVQ